MAKKLTKGIVTNGSLIKVANIDRAPTALHSYILTYFEDKDGKNERPVLITESELKRTSRIVIPGPLILGRLYPIRIYNRDGFAVNVRTINKQTETLFLTSTKIGHWENRAKKNPEDIPTKHWLINLLD